MTQNDPPETPSHALRDQDTVVPVREDSAAASADRELPTVPPDLDGDLDGPTRPPPPAPASASRAEPPAESPAAASEQLDDDEPHPGLRVDRYQLVREIGRGGMGTVFLARDEALGRSVAIKFLSIKNKEFIDRFFNEARLTARCDHENIVILYDAAEYRGRPYMVLEYLEGETVEEMLQRARREGRPTVPVTRAVDLMLPVVRALAYAHSMGIIHRDLKPANVIVTNSGVVKVVDFGVAKVLAGTDGGTGAAPATQGVGTLPYMAPEQLSGQPIDARVDIWAVGIMLHTLVVGEHPMAPLHLPQLQELVDMDRPMPRMTERHPELGDLASIIDSCLVKQLDRRTSATALLEALEQLHADARDLRTRPARPRRQNRRADTTDRARIGPYAVREQIGEGGMAVVYRAHQPAIDRDVAIKVMNRSLAGDKEAMVRFTREARLVARLEHPHILPIYDFDAGHEPPYLVMRYLSGGTLHTLAQTRALSPVEVADILSQVCSALHYAHRQGVVHRDVKPSNILIDRDGYAFVSDFGIARMVARNPDNSITGAGEAIGTAEYMAPEQAQGLKTVDARVDVYALGIIAFQLLTGSLPFTGGYVRVLMQQVNEPAPPLRALAPDAPAALEAIVARALAKDPDARFPSAADFDQALRAAVEAAGASASDSDPVVRQPVAAGTLDGDERTALGERNKHVTALHMEAGEYADLVTDERGADAALRAVRGLLTEARMTIEKRGGVLAAHTEDTLTAVWGVQSNQQNDAERAIRVALALVADMRERVGIASRDSKDMPEVLPVDIGVHAGVMQVLPAERAETVQISGTAIRQCRRLARRANGAVVITQPVYNQVRGLFTMRRESPLTHRRRPGEIPVYRVLGARPDGLRVPTRGIEGVETAMIGRDAELKSLQNAYLDALEERESQLVTVVGDLGLGKSRLLYEFYNWLDLRTEQPRLLTGGATPDMTHRAYALLRDMVTSTFRILDSDSPAVIEHKLAASVAHLVGPDTETAHLLGHLIGFDLDHSPHVAPLLDDPRQLNTRARQLFRRLVRDACRDQPTIVTYEDVHHADEASLDLILEVVREERDVPLVIVCLARPALFDSRPDWGQDLDCHHQVVLRPLDRREGRRLAREILRKLQSVPKELRDLLVARSEGNPYFMEELVRMLIDDRIIRQHSDRRWHLERERLAHLQVPSTLRGLVQAKLDSLLPSERLVLQRAAVLGPSFHDQALTVLDRADDTQVDDLAAVLDRLRAQKFIADRGVSSIAGSAEYLFVSSIAREVVLETLLERQRILYNRVAAEWLIATGGERLEEHLGLIADRYERAGDRLAAAEYLERAGRQSLERYSFRDAQSFFVRALDLQPEAPVRHRVRLGLAQAKFQMGESAEARAHAAAVLAEVDADRDAALDAALVVGAHCQLAEVARQACVWVEAREHLERALPLARASADDTLLAQVLTELAQLSWHLGDLDRARALAEESLQLARQLGARVLELKSMNALGVVAALGGDLDRAHELWTEGVARAREAGNRDQAARMLGNLGEVARRRGNFETARAWYRQSEDMHRDLEQQYALFLSLCNRIHAELALHRESDARAALVEALALCRALDTLRVKLICVIVAGHVLGHTGQWSRGLGLLGLVERHPATLGDDRDGIAWVLDQLGLDPARSDAADALAAGHALDLDQVVAELAGEFS